MAPALNAFLLRLKALVHRRRMDRDMQAELAFHRAMLREKLLRQGKATSEVEQAIQHNFGRTSYWHERLRELWQFTTLENFLRDVTFSLRLLSKSRTFTTVSVLTLALGLGANTAIFSLMNALLLRPLPVPHASQLALLRIDQLNPRPSYTMGAPFLRDLERHHEVFTDVFAFSAAKLQVRSASGNEEVDGQYVSGEFFRGLQTPPLLGRTLSPQDDRTGGNPSGLAVVISEPFWKSWFHGAANVLGQTLEIDHHAFVVVGVMPKSFIGASPTQRPKLYLPLSAEALLDAPDSLTSYGHRGWWLTVMARLRPGVTLDQANSELLALSMPIVREAVPDAEWVADAQKNHARFIAEPGSRGFTYLRILFSKPLGAVLVMCAGILLLACLNLTSLLLARSTARQRELATRLALGASRRRLMQQLLIESLLLALLGMAAGLVAAPLVSRLLAGMLLRGTDGMPGLYLDTALDWRALAFAGLIALASAMMIGLVPAFRATSSTLSDQIKAGHHAANVDEHRRLLPRILMASEVALALMLVLGAGLLMTSLLRLYRSGAGFDPQGVVNIAFDMDKQPRTQDALVELYQHIGEELRRQPGVKSASFALLIPLTGSGWDEGFSGPDQVTHEVDMNLVGPDYFETMRIPILAGRDFRWNDTRSSGYKIILNQAAATLFFPGRNALGEHVLLPGNGEPDAKSISYEVIAIVGDVKYYELSKAPPAGAYIFLAQNNSAQRSCSAVLRVEGPVAPLTAAARSITMRLAPEVPMPVVTTMNQVLDDSISSERLMAILSAFFAASALLVTGIGLYGTLAYDTARRTSEIGIRMALGARRPQVLFLIFRRNATIVVTGLLAGLMGGLLGTRLLASFLYGTSPRDPWVLAGALLAMCALATCASLLPSLRAARIEPITAIRCE